MAQGKGKVLGRKAARARVLGKGSGKDTSYVVISSVLQTFILAVCIYSRFVLVVPLRKGKGHTQGQGQGQGSGPGKALAGPEP